VRRSKPPPTKKYFITIIISPKYIIVKQIFIKESISVVIIIKYCQIIIKNVHFAKNAQSALVHPKSPPYNQESLPGTNKKT
jgi:hypothetical protein